MRASTFFTRGVSSLDHDTHLGFKETKKVYDEKISKNEIELPSHLINCKRKVDREIMKILSQDQPVDFDYTLLELMNNDVGVVRNL